MTLTEFLERGAHAEKEKQWEFAAEQYASACAAYAESHEGEEDPDILYRYGQALFQFARQQVNMLNTENANQPKVQSENIELAPLPDIGGDDGADQSPEQEPEQDAEENKEQEQEAEKDDLETSALDDDVDDFTAAWQIVDLCRVLYGRQLEIAKDKRPLQLKLANVYHLLGEIAIDDDMYGQAAEDFTSALALKEELLEANDRLLSEANYMCGLAHEMKGHTIDDKTQALKHMKAALEISKKAGVGKEALQELKQKVHDLNKEIESLSKPQESAPAAGASSQLEQMMSARGMLAQDIGGMVKRKKAAPKPEESDAKKSKKE